MTVEDRIKSIIDDHLSEEELLKALTSTALHICVNAILELSKRPDPSPPVVDALVALALGRGRKTRLLGITTLPCLATAALSWIGSEQTIAAYEAIMAKIDEPRASDIRQLIQAHHPDINKLDDHARLRGAKSSGEDE